MLTDMEKLEDLARMSAAKWRQHRLYEDLLQEARCTLWQNYNPHYSRGSNIWIAQKRIIDVLRQQSGRKHSRNYQQRTYDLLRIDPSLIPPLEFRDETDIIMEIGLEGRHLVIARMLELGFPKQDIAEHLGLHPSRISQILIETRKIVGESL